VVAKLYLCFLLLEPPRLGVLEWLKLLHGERLVLNQNLERLLRAAVAPQVGHSVAGSLVVVDEAPVGQGVPIHPNLNSNQNEPLVLAWDCLRPKTYGNEELEQEQTPRYPRRMKTPSVFSVGRVHLSRSDG
jgi:hypothetical protein